MGSEEDVAGVHGSGGDVGVLLDVSVPEVSSGVAEHESVEGLTRAAPHRTHPDRGSRRMGAKDHGGLDGHVTPIDGLLIPT